MEMIMSKGMMGFIIIMILVAFLGAYQNKTMKIKSEQMSMQGITINQK